MPDNAAAHLSPVWSHYTEIIAQRGEGCWLYDAEGRAYLDFTSGIGVTSTGHCHPRVVQAIQTQAERLIHGQVNIVLHRPILDLVQELRGILPESLDGYFFSNSGAEAVEASVKLARAATGRTNIIVFQGSFHGRTVGTMSLTTSKTIYRAGYQPMMPGVFVAPYPYAFRYGWSPEDTCRWCLDELRFLLQTQTAPSETAAVLVEPVLGEGGYVVPPDGFLEGLRDLCDEHGILLILDEVQSGVGRTGRWFAYEHFDVVPDILVVAKGLASGMPLSGIVSRLALMGRWELGSHGGTYGGNAVACAAAVATLQTIREEGLLDNVQRRGAQLMAGLQRLQKDHPGIGDVRGLGLMLGIEFVDSAGLPDKAAAKAIIHACLDQGLLLLSCGPWDNTIRLIPPLVLSEGEADQALDTLAAALESTGR